MVVNPKYRQYIIQSYFYLSFAFPLRALRRCEIKIPTAPTQHAHIYLQALQYRLRPDKPLTAPQSIQAA